MSNASLLRALLLMVACVLAPWTAFAQGTCRCNNGCHQYPGQCVQGGASGGCDPGYAPFCENRGSDCRSGWVSCSGTCQCVRVGPSDAGAADVPRSDVVTTDVPATSDVPRSDVPATSDVPASMPDVPRSDVPPVSFDVPPGADVPPGSDVPPGTDAPPVISDAPPVSSDVPPGTDAPPVGFDVPPGSDGGTAPTDRPMSDDLVSVDPDAGVAMDVPGACVCPGGVCVQGICITERCEYQPELGFLCRSANTACRLVNNEPWCLPACLGVMCDTGSFCDESLGGACTQDRCASIRCAGGLVCRNNRCGRIADGGVFVEAPDGGLSTGPTTGEETGCGCRAGAPSSRVGSLAGLGVLGGLALLRRRRARR